MKTIFFFRAALVLTLVVMAFSQKAEAQVNCPFNINNNLSCRVVVRYTLYDPNCNLCYSSMDIVIGANSSYNIPCGAFTCGPSCDLDLLLINDNGVTVWTTINSTNTGPVAVPGAPCSGGDNMVWGASNVDINP